MNYRARVEVLVEFWVDDDDIEMYRNDAAIPSEHRTADNCAAAIIGEAIEEMCGDLEAGVLERTIRVQAAG